MKVINQSVEYLRGLDDDALKFLERCGRTCYKSEEKITETSAENFVRNLIKRGHESVLEHVSVSFRIITDRGILAELTRHRLASFSVESSRYCDYVSDKFGGEVTCIEQATKKTEWGRHIKLEMDSAACAYRKLRELSAPPEIARAVLPMSLKTELVMTANLREWRHILKLRTSKAAHPQMRELAGMILEIFRQKIPVIVEDIKGR